MPTQLQLRRGTTAQTATFTGAAGEITVDTTKNAVVVHDGSTPGGWPSVALSAVNTWSASQIYTANVTVIQSTTAGDTANTYGHTNYTSIQTGNTNSYLQAGLQNFSNGANASVDFSVYNNLGSDSSNYIDIGMLATGYNVVLNSFTAASPGDAYVYSNTANLIIGTDSPSTNVKVMVGYYASSNVAAVFSAPNLASVSTSTGTLVVNGGLGVTGNVYATGVYINGAAPVTLGKTVAIASFFGF